MAETYEELREQYEAFLNDDRLQLADRIASTIDDFRAVKGPGGAAAGCPRVTIGMAELRSQGDGRLSRLMRLDPLRHLRALEAACHSIAEEQRAGYDKDGAKIKVALAGPVGAAPSSPRQLTSACLRQLVCVEGVATQVSTVKPKVVRSVHYCPATAQHQARDYVDATDPSLGLNALDAQGRELPDRVVGITSAVYPTRDAEGRDLETEFGLSTFKDHQTITLQEMPEKAPMGQLPRSVELVLDHDLVDRIKPGDRVMVVGVYRALARTSNGQPTASGVFRTVVLVNNVQVVGRDVSHLNFTPQDIHTIRSLAGRKDILSILGRSISPSIHGHTVIKKALALQLLSGVEKNLDNGTHLRGDINILMVGDPSTAKSQLLRAAMTIAPLAVSTTGKGSSGVGLTAAVTSDPDTRERRLEAGAMVLADRGLVCVDEFDKMGENDRVAIHEAMEQQTVTIAKAGIHASLNARCSVLAAANPVYGQYDRRRRIQENIGLPDSLLSRFDLLFVVLDQMDPETDRRIATHVIRGHRYRNDHGQTGHDSDFDDDDGSDAEDHTGDTARVQSVWQRGRLQAEAADSEDDAHSRDVLQHEFLRKFIHYAKTRKQPVLTDAAREFIAHRYAEMRARQDERTLPITARSLETVIRLATAHAKARLSDTVEAEPDCEAAMDILGFALYHENHGHRSGTGTEAEAAAAAKRRVVSDDEGSQSEGDDGTDSVTGAAMKRARTEEPVSGREEEDVASKIWRLLHEHDGELPESSLDPEQLGATPDAIRAALDALGSKNRVMVTDGVIYSLGD